MSSLDAHSTLAGDEHDGDDYVQLGSSVPFDTPETEDGTASISASASASASVAASASTTRHISLFSPDLVAAVPSPSSETHTGPAIDHATTPSPPPSASRTLPALASLPRRTTRLKVSDQHAPIVQLHTQIPRAQKSGDDPSTPLDTKSRKRTTHDLIGHEHSTLTTLSRLFGETTAMSNARAPSYNHATGPLHVRASSEAIPLPDHLYTRGLLEGRHSDITVVAFGQRYNLHRLILDRAPFFTTALSEPWIESQSREVCLYPEQIDPSITQAAFELAIRKLYGVEISKDSDVEAIGLFATGCWLEMQDLIDSAIESILRQMAPETLAYLIRLVTTNYYGRSGDRILESAKAMLSRNGWEMPLKYWDDMPGDIIRELVGSDGFFVNSEWDRWVLAKRLLDRRLRQAAVEAGLVQRGQRPLPQAPQSMRLMAVRFDGVYRQPSLAMTQSSSDASSDWLALYTNPDIERIMVLLDQGVHYIHMEYEQLNYIRNARDIFGLPVMPEKVISNALWQQLSLRQMVLNADESAQELGLCKWPPEPETANVATKTEGVVVAKGKQKTNTSAPAASDSDSDGWNENGKPRKFWIPSSDCNIVLGNGADPVVTTSSSFQRHATRLSASMQPEDAQWATDFASTPSNMANPNTRMDSSSRPISAGGSNAGQPRPIAYTEFPPFRFAAEFPNPRFLKEKKRVYSRTVSYAGSLWNIYIQKVRSAKSVQLGVYLHRAKEESNESVLSSISQPNNGSVDARIGQLEREMLMRSDRRERRRSTREPFNDQTAEEDTSGSGGDADTTLVSAARTPRFSPENISRRRSSATPHISTRNFPRFQFQSLDTSSPADNESLESPASPMDMCLPLDRNFVSSDEDEEELDVTYPNPSLTSSSQRKSRLTIPAIPPYVDGRPTIKTYFKIYSPSKGGRMLSIYESAPDRFNFSQSWGWKSSTLMLDEITISGSADEVTGETGAVPMKKGDGKLRFMVVIGNL